MANFHMIRTDDMLNGDGLRVVLFFAGCEHHCEGCHNPETWDCNSGKELTKADIEQIYAELEHDYISGITFSGGDPMHFENVVQVAELIYTIKYKFPNKTIWLYTGCSYETMIDFYEVMNFPLHLIDVVVDGEYDKSLADVKYPWAGSTNQRVIDVKASLASNDVVLYKGAFNIEPD